MALVTVVASSARDHSSQLKRRLEVEPEPELELPFTRQEVRTGLARCEEGRLVRQQCILSCSTDRIHGCVETSDFRSIEDIETLDQSFHIHLLFNVEAA